MKLLVGYDKSPVLRLVCALALSNGLSVVLFLLRVFGSGEFRYWYMLWNLLLAWVPVLFSFWLVRRLRSHRWTEAKSLGLTVLWLGFLPNSFYVVSDLIHLQSTGEINILFDSVLFFSFIFNSYVAGYISSFMVHTELKKRLSAAEGMAVMAGVFLLSGFAIYLGRVLRWNTWDLLINPAGILFDASEGVINPLASPQMLMTTGTFFLLIGATYGVVYQVAQLLMPAPRRKRRAK